MLIPRLEIARILFAGLLALIATRTECAPPAGYYDSAQGKTGAALRRALHAIITNAVVIPYSSTARADAVDALMDIDQDWSNTNNVILIYSGWSTAKTNFNATNQFGWEREHLWPNSYGIDSRGPAYSDLHNLRPIDSNVNSSRGNKFYDYSDPADVNFRFPAFPEAPLCSSDTDSWEPPDTMKGDIARAVFYMDIRYEGDRVSEDNLTLTSDTATIASSTNRMGRLSTLLQWHQLDPVDERESKRNDLVFSNWQHNRNPFVDRPEWVDLVYRPRIATVHGSNFVQLSWGTEFSNAVVETTMQLNAGWLPLATASTNTGDNLVAYPAITNAVQYYRLRVP
jgi:endonuclease I